MLTSTLFMIELKDASASNEILGILPYDSRHIMEGNKYIPIPAKVAEAIIDPLRKGYQVKVSDRLKEDKNGSVSLEDFEVKKPSEFEELRCQEISRTYDRFGATISKQSILRHYIYFATAILLSERGFLITDDNREEKYLEIINTGDEFLLKTLEDYLEARDNLTTLAISYKEFQEYVRRVQAAETIEDIEKIKEDFPF